MALLISDRLAFIIRVLHRCAPALGPDGPDELQQAKDEQAQALLHVHGMLDAALTAERLKATGKLRMHTRRARETVEAAENAAAHRGNRGPGAGVQIGGPRGGGNNPPGAARK